MHKTKVIAGAGVVAVALVFLPSIMYSFFVRDCADFGDIAEQMSKPCTRAPALYVGAALFSGMLIFGGWILIFGLKSYSLVTFKS